MSDGESQYSLEEACVERPELNSCVVQRKYELYVRAESSQECTYETVNLLSAQPGIGMPQQDISGGRYRYRGYLMHPFYKIIYRNTRKTLYVCAIRATRKQK